MNVFLLWIAISLPGQSAAASTTATDLTSFDSVEGRFRVMLPATPQAQHFALDTPFGKAEMNIFLVEKSTSEAYGVVFTDYLAAGQLDADKVLDSNRDDQIAGVKGKLLESRVLKVGDIHGRSFEYEFTIADGTKLTGRTRLFLLKKRLYQVGVIGSDEVALGKIGTKFLNSFEMTEIVKPVSKAKAKAQAKKNQAKFNEEAALRAISNDPELMAKIEKLRAEQSSSLKKLREEIEKTQIPKEERQAIWIKAHVALDRLRWEAYHLFDQQTDYRKKADYLEKKQLEYLGAVMTEFKTSKEVLELIRQEGIIDEWEVAPYPSCDVKEVAKKLKVEVRGLEGEFVYHRPTCLILTKALENPDAKEIRMTLYKAMTTADVRPCPSCLP